MGIYLLFHHSDAVAQHNNFMEEYFNRQLLRFLAFICWLQNHRATHPSVAEGNYVSDLAPQSQNPGQGPFHFANRFNFFRKIINPTFNLEINFISRNLAFLSTFKTNNLQTS